ncbi:MAG: prephenate dehydrogenase/arogenate dehydrogenase family protein [Candidatus Sumerlaeia bacterium]|nr:prephenate dehydrogenase/arogenate dehydrogenase family protein [Candidatus Sumerlaeia bacterium]
MHIGTLAIYGVGLLGGSVGLAARAHRLADRIIGIGRSEERLAEAVERGAIDEFTTSLEDGCADADWIVLCSTVSHIVELLPRLATLCKASAIVTDVGSTKATIVAEAEKHFGKQGPLFVGSHPMAGSERSGVAHASADLFVNACCVVTPTRQTKRSAIERVELFWRAFGGRTVRLDPQRHDRLVALVSHLPHMAAVGVLLTAAESREDTALLATILGNGFRDTTRVAAGPPEVWRDICLENRTALADALEHLGGDLLIMADEIRDGQGDAVLGRLVKAREFRKRLIP